MMITTHGHKRKASNDVHQQHKYDAQLSLLEQSRRQTGIVNTLNKVEHLERATKRIRQQAKSQLDSTFDRFAQFFDEGAHEELIVEDLSQLDSAEPASAEEEWQIPNRSPLSASKAKSQLERMKANMVAHEQREKRAQEERMRQAALQAKLKADAEQREKERQLALERKREEEELRLKQEQEIKKKNAEIDAQNVVTSKPGSNAHPVSSDFKAERTHSAVVSEAVRRHEKRVALEPTIQQVLQKRKKFVNKVKVHISMMSGTINSLQHAFVGRPNNPGARSLLEMVEQKAQDQLPAFMQIIADRIVEVAGQNIAPDAIKNGESNFALAYLATGLCVRFPAFYEHLLGALQEACPYIVPGLRTKVEKLNLPLEERRRRLGMLKDEADAAYLARMQATVGWYGAFLQANLAVLASPQYNIVPPNSRHPVVASSPEGWEPMAHAWRWIAATLNGTKWRWSRYLVQAFLAVVGYEMSRREPYATQVVKVVRLLGNPLTQAALDKSAKLPDDNDRRNVFKEFVEGILSKRRFDPPGREDKSRPGGWDDKRNLPSEVSENRAE